MQTRITGPGHYKTANGCRIEIAYLNKTHAFSPEGSASWCISTGKRYSNSQNDADIVGPWIERRRSLSDIEDLIKKSPTEHFSTDGYGYNMTSESFVYYDIIRYLVPKMHRVAVAAKNYLGSLDAGDDTLNELGDALEDLEKY